MTRAPLSFYPRLRFGILERYVARAFLAHFGLLLPAFAGIYLVVDFFEKIDRLLRAHVSLATVLFYFTTKIPLVVGQVLPAVILLSVMLTFSLLSRSNETIAIKSAGFHILRLLRPLILLALLFSIGLAGLNLYLIPWSNEKLHTIWETAVDKKPARSFVKLERFWYKGDRAIYNILAFDRYTQTLEGVRIYLFDDQFHLRQLIAASRAQWTGLDWQFYQGLIQHFLPDGGITGESFTVRRLELTERPADFSTLEKKVTEMDLSELNQYIHRLQRDRYDSTPYYVELLGRFSFACTPLIVTLIGAGLSLLREKTNIAMGIATGIGIIFTYWLLVSFFLSLGQVGKIPPLVAAWLPNFLFLLGSGVLLCKVSR